MFHCHLPTVVTIEKLSTHSSVFKLADPPPTDTLRVLYIVYSTFILNYLYFTAILYFCQYILCFS